MTVEIGLMILILIGMFALLIWNKIPAWAVFMLTLTVTMTLGLAPEGDLLKGFANTSVATVGTLFVVAAGMYSTGAITLIADKFIGLPETLNSAMTRILPPTAIGSAFLNNTPLVAMMIPVVRDVSQAARLASSKLLIPLSFASILGGASTLIGTSVNLIIAGLVVEQLGMELNIFFPARVGVPAAIVGILFVMIVGTRLLPDNRKDDEETVVKRVYRAEFIVSGQTELPAKKIVARTGMSEKASQPLAIKSVLDGKTVKAAGFASTPGFQLVRIERNEETIEAIDPEFMMREADILVFEAEAEAMPSLWATMGLSPRISMNGDGSDRHAHKLVETVVSSNANAIGRFISELPLPDSPFEKVSLVGLSRDGRFLEDPLRECRVEAGDGAILEVSDDFFYEARTEQDFSLTKRLRGYSVQRVDRAIIATVITTIMILLAAFNVMSMLNAALLASVAMLLTGCLPLRRAWRSIDWQTLVVLGAAIGLESAVTATGLSDLIADALFAVGGDSPMIALTVVYIGAIIMTNVITNAAAAAFMFPVAISLADQLGVSPLPFVAILMLGASYAFINPAGYQTNLMVQEPGGYTFADFAKVGVPLTILAGLVALLLAPFVYGF